MCPEYMPKQALKTFNALSKASASGLIKAMHDCSEGGIGVAASEMAFAGGLGMELFLSEVPYKARRKTQEMILFYFPNLIPGLL